MILNPMMICVGVLTAVTTVASNEEEERAAAAIEKLKGKITRVGKAGPIIGVDLVGTKVTDADLKYLRKLKGLQKLQLGSTQTSDAGVKELEELGSVSKLIFIR